MCNERDTKEVAVGDLKYTKKGEHGKGKKWNDKSSQNWPQFPVQELVAQLGHKLARFGIRLGEQDERGTSRGKCSLCGSEDRSKLRRAHRGLFLCRNCGTVQNADVNGVGNQLARYLRRESKVSAGSSGSMAQPLVWLWHNHRRAVVI